MKILLASLISLLFQQFIVPQTNAPANVAAKLSAEEVVKKVQSFYDDTKDYQATFSQVYTYKAYGRTQKSQGRVYFKKSGKMRWEYSKPSKKYFIANGVDLWVYEPEEKQAYKQALEESQLPVVLTFLFGKGKLLDAFTPKLLAADKRATDPTDYVVELAPKKEEGDYKKIVMVIGGKDFFLKDIFIYDPVDNENRLTFTKPSINKGIDDTQFSFTPPADVKIVTPNEE